MMRRLKIVVVSGIAALLLPMADGRAQQDGRSRLMFDPSGVQGSPSRTAPVQPSPTTGQSTTSRQSVQTAPPAARAPAAPQQSTAPKPAVAAKPAARTAPARTAGPRRPAQSDNAGNGGQEIRNWIALLGAVPGWKGEVLAYEPVPEWITGCATVWLAR